MTDWKSRRVGVVMGGLSAEREVSLSTGKGVLEALRGRGYDAVGIDWRELGELPGLLAAAGVEVVWNALHGTYGEDGAVQGLLACLGIPGTGSGILASALAMDKIASKRIFETSGVPTARWRVLAPGEGAEAVAGWDLPLVVKPSREGSSVGVTIARDRDAVAAAIAEARRHRGEPIVEQYVPGREVCVGILDEQVIGTCEIRPAVEFYTYEAKYQRSDTQYLVPAPLEPAVDARVREVALAAHRALGCSGHNRVDLRVGDGGELAVLECNTLPGMTATSLLPKLAKHAGMSYADLCERILASAR